MFKNVTSCGKGIQTPLYKKVKPVALHAKQAQSGGRGIALPSGVPRNFFSGGGVQQIHLRTEGRENGNLGAVAP